MNWRDALITMAPEHLLLAGIVVILVMEIVSRRHADGFGVAVVAVAAACACAAMLALAQVSAAPFPGQFAVAPLDLTAKAIVLGLAVPVLLLSRDEFAETRFHALVLSSLYGVCLVLSAESFLTLFVGLELMSLPVYVLVVLAYRDTTSAEAALKYLVLGGVASACLLMGAALVYGDSGSLAFRAFAAALTSAEAMTMAGVALVAIAFFLKAAVVPFHTWAPDAYEGATVPVTAYMATIVKAAVLLAAVRLFSGAFATPIVDLVAVLPLVSIVWGNLAAMRQKSFRRMIAYSSVAHAGYLFYALLGEPAGRYQAVLFYVLAYGVMNVLAFAALPKGADEDRIDGLRGLFARSPYAAVMMAVAMLSLAGIPPLPGFVAKFLVFKNVIAAGYTLYGVLGLVGSYLGIYFYLRVIQLMFMAAAEKTDAAAQQRELMMPASLLCLAASIVIGVLPGWVLAQL
jgi:NADH-quinone oxidoreductase subunit N